MNNTITTSLKQQGYRVTITHFRYHQNDVKLLQKLTTHGFHLPKEKENLITKFANDLEIQCQNHNIFTNRKDISPFGGETQVLIEKDGETFIGTSTCHLVDNFVKKKGREKAFGRALSQLANRKNVSL